MEALAKVGKARMRMLITEPFFATLAMHMAIVEDAKAQDIWTDGNTLAFNPSFVETAKSAHLEALIAKAVMHCANFHPTRRGGRDLKEWNKACAYAVNPFIRDAGFELPPGSLFRADFEGYSAEEIFSKMKAEKRKEEQQGGGKGKGQDGSKQGQNGAPSAANGQPDQSQAGAPGNAPAPGAGQPGNDPAAPGEIRDGAPAHEPAALAEMETDWTIRTRQALAAALKKGHGNLPGHLQQLAIQTIQPRIDWKSEWRNFIDRSSTSSRSWNRPNRRFISRGLILPGKVPAAISHLVIGVDNSASIDQDAFSAFKAENAAAFAEGIVDQITVVYFNAAVNRVDVFQNGDEFTMETKAGGGTKFSPLFRWVEENADDAAAVVVFTDLDSTDFGPEPDLPVLWAAYGDSKAIARRAAAAPFGDTIYIAA